MQVCKQVGERFYKKDQADDSDRSTIALRRTVAEVVTILMNPIPSLLRTHLSWAYAFLSNDKGEWLLALPKAAISNELRKLPMCFKKRK